MLGKEPMLKFIQKIKLFLLATILTTTYLVVPTHALEPKDLTKSYTAILGTDLGKVLVYEPEGVITNFTSRPTSPTNGISLKVATENDKYGLYLSGKPLDMGDILFQGSFDDNEKYHVSFSVTVNIGKATKQITKNLTATVGTEISDEFIYDSAGQLEPVVNKSEKGLSLRSTSMNGRYGLHLTGTPTEAGTVTFSGTTVDNGTYDISYSITITISNQKNDITKKYNATVNKKIKDTVVYSSSGQFSTTVNETKNGLTLKSDNTDGNGSLRLSGTPTEAGTVKFTGTITDTKGTDTSYEITVEIAEEKKEDKDDKKDEEKKEDTSTTGVTNTDDENGPNLGLIIGIAAGILLLIIVVIILLTKKKKGTDTPAQSTPATAPIAPAEPADEEPAVEAIKPAEPTEEELEAGPVTDGIDLGLDAKTKADDSEKPSNPIPPIAE